MVGECASVVPSVHCTMASVSQSSPEKYVAHAQVYASEPSVQTPPFWHGLLPHSSTSASQFVPLKPAWQEQV